MSAIIMVSRRQVALFGEMRGTYLFIFLNTFKYVSAHETITPDKCFNNIEKEE